MKMHFIRVPNEKLTWGVRSNWGSRPTLNIYESYELNAFIPQIRAHGLNAGWKETGKYDYPYNIIITFNIEEDEIQFMLKYSEGMEINDPY